MNEGLNYFLLWIDSCKGEPAQSCAKLLNTILAGKSMAALFIVISAGFEFDGNVFWVEHLAKFLPSPCS